MEESGLDVGGMPTVGMVGGGQLARMTHQAAIGLAVPLRVLTDSAHASAARVSSGVQIGDHTSLDDLRAFAKGCDVVTFDHEHVPNGHIAALEADGVTVRPGSAALLHTQDKAVMRERLSRLGVPCPRWRRVATPADVAAFAEEAGWPIVLKAIRGGYDGRGVWLCESPATAAEICGYGVPLLAERYVRFGRELAVLIARSPSGQAIAYPVVETVQRGGICHEVIAPAPDLTQDKIAQAKRLALRMAGELAVVGLLAVEMFDTGTGVIVNELAMRPHNSGHWTIEGARTSQFEQHLRAVLDLPLGSSAMSAPYVVMANVLGGSDPAVYRRYRRVMAYDPALKIHFYGKQVRPGRKIGHVTALGDDLEETRERARLGAGYLRGEEPDQ